MFQAGKRFGPYEVLSLLGAGGMGEVYRARDTRLGREVAVKVLPSTHAADTERLQRFEREAKAVSALAHPNILVLHDIGFEDGTPYVVTELLEGEVLRSTLSAGALPVRVALDYALQTARGLAVAHAKGVVHRDLKPENLFVTRDGHVKILDFGLAKLSQVADPVPTEDPTISRVTEPGVVLGTVGYMSPEQVRGQPADARSDIFAFGAILYEMLSGRRAFTGDSPAERLSAILREDPADVEPKRTGGSPGLERVVRRCLEKKPEARFHAAHDVALALEALSLPGGDASAAVAAPRVPQGRWQWPVTLLVATVVAAAGGALAGRSNRSPSLAIRMTVPVDAAQIVNPGANPTLAVSPDGRLLVYHHAGLLQVRPLDSFAATPLQGTQDWLLPAFSPDGRWLAGLDQARGQIRRIAATGGPVSDVVSCPGSPGMSWGDDDRIYFAAGAGSSGIWRVPSGGGVPEPVTRVDDGAGENVHVWPQLLPGGRDLLFTVVGPSQGSADSRVVVETIGSGRRKTLLERAAFGRYLQSGHLLFTRDDTVFAVPYEHRGQNLAGPPFAALSGVHVGFWGGAAALAVSNTGTLAYSPPPAGPLVLLRLTDLEGRDTKHIGPSQWMAEPRFSPDGRRVAVDVREPSQHDIWIFDVQSGQGKRFTFELAEDEYPVWSPDGRQIAYSSAWTGQSRRLFVKPADGSGEARLVRTWPRHAHPTSWSPDGRWLLLHDFHAVNGWDLWAVPLDGSEPVAVATSVASEASGVFSPDGRWLAYRSNESGRSEIYAVSFPALSGKQQVSAAGGDAVRWDAAGKSLYYADGNGLWAIPVSTTGSLGFGSARKLFQRPLREFDVAPDGRHFALIVPNPDVGPQPIHVLLDWFAELKLIPSRAIER